MWFFTRPLSLFLTHLSALGSILVAADPVFPHSLPNSKPCVKFFFFSFLLQLDLDYSSSHFQGRPVWQHYTNTRCAVHKQEVVVCFMPCNWVVVCAHFYISCFVSAGCKRANCNTLPWWSRMYWYFSAAIVRWPQWPYLIKLSMTYQPRKKKSMLPGNRWEREKKTKQMETWLYIHSLNHSLNDD